MTYDFSFLDTPPASPASPEYDFSFLGEGDHAATLARGAALFGRKDAIDRQRTALDLKRELGEDWPAAIVNPETDRKRILASQMDHAFRRSPDLQRWALADPENASLLIAEDAKRMAAVGEAIRAIQENQAIRATGRTLANLPGRVAGGALRFPAAGYALAGGAFDWSHQAAIWAGIEDAGTKSPVGRFLRGQGDNVNALADWMGTLAGKPQGNIEAGLASGAEFLGQLPFLVASGPAWIYRLLGGMTAGQSYLKGMAETGDTVKSSALAATDSAAEVFMERTLGLGQLFKIPGIKQGMAEFAKKTGNFLWKDALGEGITTVWQNMNEWAYLHPDKTLDDFIAEQPDALIQTAAATLMAGGGQVAIMQRMGASRRAETRALFDALHQSADGSALREKLPEKYREFVAQATKDGPVSQVFIPAERFTTYFQSAGMDPAQVAADLNATNYADAVAIGSDVVVPLADFATHVAGTDHYAGLADDLRLHQGDLTAREAALEEANREESDRKAEESMRQMAEEGKRAQGINAAIDRIVGDIEGQLIGAGVERGTANAQANLMRGVAVAAQRAFPGQDVVQSAEKLWATYGLTVKRDLPAVLAQMKNVDLELDPLLDMLRGSGGPTDRQTFGVSLVDFLRARGGLKPVGELTRMDADVKLRPFQKKLLREDGMDMDMAAMLATEHGYFPGRESGDVTETELVNAIDADLSGSSVYSAEQTDERLMGLQQSLGALWQAVQSAGIDLAKTGNPDVRRVLEQSGEVTGAYFQGADEHTATAMRELSAMAQSSGNENRTVEIGLVASWEVAAAARAGVDIAGFRHSADMYAVRHAFKKHGDIEKEAARGQIAVSEAVIASIPQVVTQPDSVILGLKNERGQDLVFSVRALADGTVLVVEEVRTGKKLLAMSSIRRVPGAKNAKELLPSVLLNARSDAGVEPIIVDAPRQFNQGARGYLQIAPDRKMAIGLTKKANLSTFLHETGHFYLEMMGDLAEMEGVSQEVKDDYALLLKQFGVTSRDQITTEHHEWFARANEAYLMEGRAPAPELQGVFARFREWLKMIYRKLDVDLSDEVRGVFDRIYATDAEIEAARAESPGPMPQPAGMTGAEYAAYLESDRQAVEAGKEELQARLMREMLRAKKEWWRDEREQVRGEVTAEVDAQPVYAAWNDLMGEGEKLSAPILEHRYGADFLKALPRGFGRIYTREGGIDPEVAAMKYGFDSADALIKAIAEMRNRRELIEAETDARMRERHGDLLTDGTIAEAAMDALHNDRKTEVLAIELKALGNRESVAALKRAVAATLGRTTAQDIRPGLYLAAERKAARQAFDAATRQDFPAAREAKRRELLNHLLYRGATDAREETAKIEKHWKKLAFDNKARAKIGKSDQEWLAQMDGILERFSFIPFTRLQRARSLAEWLAAQEAAQAEDGSPAELPAVSPLVLREAEKRHWKELTLDELRAVDDTLASIEHVARKVNEVILNGKRFEMAEIVARVKEVAGASKLRNWTEVRPGDEVPLADSIHAVADTIYRPEKLMELLDGGTTGLFHDLLWNKAADAQVLADDLKKQVLLPLENIVTGMDAEHERRMAETIHIRGIGRSISRYEIIGIMLSTGNESSRTKLQKGGIVIRPGEPAVPISDAALEEMKVTLNAAERDMIQTIWDTIGQIYPHLNDLNIRAVGLPLKKVDASPVPMPGGEALKGGYWPAVADPRYSRIGEKQEQGQAVAAADFFPAPFANAATRHSFREERTGAVYPMNFDWKSVLSRHVNKAVVDIAYHEFVGEANRILRNTEVKAALTAKLGTDQVQGLREWLAFQVDVTTSGMLGARPADRLTSLLTGNAIVAALGFKVGVALGNAVVAPFQAMHQVKGRYLVAGIAEFMAHPKAVLDKVHTLSGEMRHRSNHLDATWTEVMERLAGKPTLRKAVMHTAMQVHMLADIIGTTGVWMGKYRQAMSEGADSREAVRAADKTIRTSQTAGAAKDLSAWERDPKNGWWKMFIGPMLIMQNEQRGAFVLQHRRIMTLFATWFIPAVLFDLAAGRGPDDDEEPEEWALRKLLVYPFLAMPHIREIASVIEASVSGKPSSVRGMPLTEAGLSAFRAGKKLWAESADEGDKVQAAIQITGLAGMPAGATGTAANYLIDLLTEETEFESPTDLRWLFIRRPGDRTD